MDNFVRNVNKDSSLCLYEGSKANATETNLKEKIFLQTILQEIYKYLIYDLPINVIVMNFKLKSCLKYQEEKPTLFVLQTLLKI